MKTVRSNLDGKVMNLGIPRNIRSSLLFSRPSYLVLFYYKWPALYIATRENWNLFYISFFVIAIRADTISRWVCLSSTTYRPSLVHYHMEFARYAYLSLKLFYISLHTFHISSTTILSLRILASFTSPLSSPRKTTVTFIKWAPSTFCFIIQQFIQRSRDAKCLKRRSRASPAQR